MLQQQQEKNKLLPCSSHSLIHMISDAAHQSFCSMHALVLSQGATESCQDLVASANHSTTGLRHTSTQAPMKHSGLHQTICKQIALSHLSPSLDLFFSGPSHTAGWLALTPIAMMGVQRLQTANQIEPGQSGAATKTKGKDCHMREEKHGEKKGEEVSRKEERKGVRSTKTWG